MTVVEFLDEHGVDYKRAGESPHVTEGRVGVVCPWCGVGTAKYGLGFDLRRGWCSCWKCGPHSTVEALAVLTGQSFWQVKKAIEPDDSPQEDAPKRRGRLELPAGLGPLLKPHRKYLRGRGYDPAELEALWQLQGIGLASKLAWRVFIPVVFRDETVSWTTRAIVDDVALRYINAKPEQEKLAAKELLYGEDLAVGCVVVTEGPTGPWRFGPGCVATLGVGYSPQQVRRIAKYPKRAVMFDSDPAAQRRAEKLCAELEVFSGSTYNIRLDSEDPGAATPKEVRMIQKEFLR